MRRLRCRTLPCQQGDAHHDSGNSGRDRNCCSDTNRETPALLVLFPSPQLARRVSHGHGKARFLMQRLAEPLLEVVVSGSHRAASNRAVNAAMARDACCLTDPLLIDKVSAISASDWSR